jgi:crotonobetainyl-CoA:carnitine CoA-transferase CaiB-like acyl-CoA transferase
MNDRRTSVGALAGIRVIDLSHQAAGPWCTSLLGDLGADVIKIEKPGRGDSIRYADRTGRLPPEIGGLNFQGLNRNKRGITVDIGQDAGVALVRRLVRDADVLVENFRPGVMDRHGLGWDALHAENPRLVYCSITAFGATGPLAQKPGMDLIVQATGGIMGHTGEEGGPPIKSAPPVADITTGVYAAYASSGRPFGCSPRPITTCTMPSRDAGRRRLAVRRQCRQRAHRGHAFPSSQRAPDPGHRRVPLARDGYSCRLPDQTRYKRLCRRARPAMRRLLTDPRFATNPSRVEHQEIGVLSDLPRRHASTGSRSWSGTTSGLAA